MNNGLMVGRLVVMKHHRKSSVYHVDGGACHRDKPSGGNVVYRIFKHYLTGTGTVVTERRFSLDIYPENYTCWQKIKNTGYI